MKQAMKMGFIIHNDLVPCDPEMSLFENTECFPFTIAKSLKMISLYGHTDLENR